jgi:hypothetical protein
MRQVWDGPTQHSMIKSRVSLAQATSLGRSSVYVMYYVFVRVQCVHCVDMMCVYVVGAIATSMLGTAACFLSGSRTFKGRRRAQRMRTNL